MVDTVASQTLTPARLPRAEAAAPLVIFAVQQPLGLLGLLVLAMIFAGAFAEFVAPYDPLAISYMAILAPPSAEHWMGTTISAATSSPA